MGGDAAASGWIGTARPGAVAACQAGYSIYFTSLDHLIRRLRTAEATGRFARQLRAYRLRLLLHCGVEWNTPSATPIRGRLPRLVA